MAMTGRERFLTALANEKPDRLPCQVHSWMPYYLKNHLKGMDQYQAYEHFGMDPVIYAEPLFEYSSRELDNWQLKCHDMGILADGYHHWHYEITTPGGCLYYKAAGNQFTVWSTEYIIKTQADFELWAKYHPRPCRVDWSPIIDAKRKVGGNGIVRGIYYDFGQCSPWQSFSSYLCDTQTAIFHCVDEPEWVHYVLGHLLDRKLRVIELGGRQEFDLVECGGGGGSSTVISPDMHREFCLPYDKKQIDAFHAQGTRVVYHLCGGLMPLLEMVAENGTDALETMTPPGMGGDCHLAEATRRVGDHLAFIGGFDQGRGFEKGTPELVREMVAQLHAACPQGGYICSPSDHFFLGDPANVQAFANVCKEMRY